jgi:uncharacterized protein involved in exopolysaccharide biosynthesis
MAVSSPTLPLFDLLGVVRRWQRPILITSAAAALVSAVIALRMPNIYPATTTFYATNLETSDPDQLGSGERKVVLLPEPADLDRAVNIGRSQPVADYIIRKYHLAAHYDYDTTATPEARHAVRELFNERLDMQISDRAVVELTFQDTDRDLAATIANDLVSRIDTVSQQLMRPNRQRVLSLFENKYAMLDKVYTATRDSLMTMRQRSGIYGMEREDRYLAKTIIEKQADLLEARARGNRAEAGALEAALKGLIQAQPGSNILTLESFAAHRYKISRTQAELEAIQADLVKARAAFETAKATLSARVSNLYVVQPAYPMARKVKPIRWLIVVSSTVIAFVLTTFAALLMEQLRGPLAPEPLTPATEPAEPADWQPARR